jgi:DNA repair exonuclease SbcCD nuclease subunit
MLNDKCLVIGDCHFDDVYQGYLTSQLDTLEAFIRKRKPKIIVFLGDLFHHRKPTPSVIVGVFEFFKRISLISPVNEIYVLRGNHDSANKADDGLTVLSTLSYPGSKVTVVLHPQYIPHLNFCFIPHYENHGAVSKALDDAAIQHLLFQCNNNHKSLVFGHFGYDGCLNSTGSYDFALSKSIFKNRTILGHIHRYKVDDNITILGTPWATNFGEIDYQKYIGEIKDFGTGEWSEMELIEMESGPRFYKVPFDALESMKDDICDPRYFTILRVVLDKFTQDSSNDLRSKILSEYKVAYVDLKFQPMFDPKLNDRISDYDPSKSISEIDDNIIDKYLDEQKSTIPTDKLREGLDKINNYADKID